MVMLVARLWGFLHCLILMTDSLACRACTEDMLLSMANKDADLIIGVGVRFSDRATGNVAKYSKNAKIIQLDTDLSEINKNVKVEIGLIGNIVSSFSRILERCQKQEHPEWREIVESLKAEEKRINDEAEAEIKYGYEHH